VNTPEKLTELLIKVAEVSVDVKHLISRQDDTGDRVEKLDDRLRVVEGMRGRLLGIAFILPLVISVTAYLVGRDYG
jgi:hypothetical protein